MFNIMANQGLLIFAVTALPFVIICLVFGYIIFRSGSKARASRNWPSTEARILASYVEPRRSRSGSGTGTSYYPVIMYEYNIGGQPFRNNRVSFGMEMGFGWAGAAQNTVNKYPAGSTVPVYYNPEQPVEAVLEQTTGSSSKILTCVVLFILFILVIVGVMTFGGMALVQQLLDGFKGLMPGR